MRSTHAKQSEFGQMVNDYYYYFYDITARDRRYSKMKATRGEKWQKSRYSGESIFFLSQYKCCVYFRERIPRTIRTLKKPISSVYGLLVPESNNAKEIHSMGGLYGNHKLP